MHWKKKLLICVAILFVGGIITYLIFSTEPTAQRAGAVRETAMLVNVTTAERDTFRPIITSVGTVVPSQDIILSPQVGGEITRLSPSFIPGGDVQKGEMLLQINPADYRNILQQRKSDLSQAIADFNIEMGRQKVAQQDYQLLNDTTLSAASKALVLREPQLEAARARVQAARAAVNQAELNLQRTTIRAPFDAHILSRNVNVGSQVSAGDNLGRLVGLDTYWVEATVPLSKIQRLRFPEKGERGSKVTIRNRTAWDKEQFRTGYLYKLVGSLEENSRMARVIISVPDPQALRVEDPDQPPLIIESFVEAKITGEPLTDVIRLSRDYIRKRNTVWVMQNNKLDIRTVDITFRDARYAYISSGLTEQDTIVTSNLSTVAEGVGLRMSTDSTTTADTVSTNPQ